MKRVTILFLKLSVLLIGAAFLGLCIFCLPWIANTAAKMYPEFVLLKYYILAIFYASTIPFFFAGHQALKLLSLIGRGEVFTELSAKALKNIKYCAVTIGILYSLGMPLFIYLGEKDDAPGIVALGLIAIYGSMIIAALVDVLERLLKDAIDIKME